MHFIALTIVIGLLILVGMVLTRILIDDPDAAQDDANSGQDGQPKRDVATQITGSLQSQAQNVRQGITTKLDEWGIVASQSSKEEAVAQFRSWATGAFAQAPEIQSWLGALADEQIRALSEHLADFCQDMGFELDWLVLGQLGQKPELEKGLTDITAHYTQASYKAVALQQEVELFRAYQDYMRNPNGRMNRELGSQLFGNLVEQGVGKISAEKHLASSPEEREQQILETIQQAEAEQPQVLNQALRTVLFGTGSANGSINGASNGIHESVGMNGSAKVGATVG